MLIISLLGKVPKQSFRAATSTVDLILFLSIPSEFDIFSCKLSSDYFCHFCLETSCLKKFMRMIVCISLYQLCKIFKLKKKSRFSHLILSVNILKNSCTVKARSTRIAEDDWATFNFW